MSTTESFDESVAFLKLRRVQRLGMHTKPGNTGWVDVDNKHILAAINLPTVMRVILANAEILKREADIKALRKAIADADAKGAEARKKLESMGVIV